MSSPRAGSGIPADFFSLYSSVSLFFFGENAVMRFSFVFEFPLLPMSALNHAKTVFVVCSWLRHVPRPHLFGVFIGDALIECGKSGSDVFLCLRKRGVAQGVPHPPVMEWILVNFYCLNMWITWIFARRKGIKRDRSSRPVRFKIKPGPVAPVSSSSVTKAVLHIWCQASVS